MHDCIIIGGGPAGLTAAIYLARFHLSIRLFDCGSSRAALIPRTRNHAGYPGGISGTDLLERMAVQADEFGVARDRRAVSAILLEGDDFAIEAKGERFATRSVLLATGVVNHRPQGLDVTLHEEALQRGLLRYCPICDAFEVTDTRVGVIGTGDRGMNEALFLRGYTRDVTLIAPDGGHDLDAACERALDDAGIVRVDGPCGGFRIDGERLAIETADGWRAYDSVYPALGSRIRSEIAVAAGARANEEGCLKVDAHQRTSLPGLYAAGDVVLGLDQISNAMGQAGVAATTIRNDLAERRPIRR